MRLALGLLLATALMPATRWGYLIYPAVLALWGLLATTPEPEPARQPDHQLERILVAA